MYKADVDINIHHRSTPAASWWLWTTNPTMTHPPTSMKITKLVTGLCMIWTIVSLYQSVSNILLLSTTTTAPSRLTQSTSTSPLQPYRELDTNEPPLRQRLIGLRNPFRRSPRTHKNNNMLGDDDDDDDDMNAKAVPNTQPNSHNQPHPVPISRQDQMLSISKRVQQQVYDAVNGVNVERWTTRAFPRWGTTVEEENQNGMDIRPLMDFIVNSSVVAYARKQDLYHPNYMATTDHSDAVGKWFPEVLYVIDHRGIYMSQKHRNITALDSSTIIEKLIPTEKLMNFSIQLLHMNYKYSKKNWPRLTNVLIDNQNPSSSGFPMLFWFGDYTECNYQNWKHNTLSIPLFTNAASVRCNHTFPFVTYQTGRDSNIDWTEMISQQQERYPWSTKSQKVIWRGSLTGKMVNATMKSPRWNMVQMVHDLQNNYDTMNDSSNHDHAKTATILDPSVLDVAATRLPPRHKDWRPSLVHELGGLVDGMPMEDFQKYRGVIDMDGNSWSSRFGRLLCYNSVVLKVEPSWVDYFYYKQDRDQESKLQPWVHYIPIQADLSDLLEMATFVADPNNDDVLIQMVQNANTWCRQNMVRRRISMDILNIWERYIELLDIGNPHWVDEHWKATKENIFHPNNPLVMDDSQIAVWNMTSSGSSSTISDIR